VSKTKQAILRAIAIKLEVETHKKYRKVLTKITWLIFIGFLGYGLYNSVIKYQHASAISNDAEYIQASVEELEDFVSETQSSYRYSFVVGENTYQKDFVASYKNYEKYMGDDGVNIAYMKSDPSQSGLAVLIKKHDSIGNIFKHFAMLFFFGGLGFLVFYMFLTHGIVQPIEEYEDDEDEQEQVQNDRNDS
jgi:hypothetical protein